MHQGNGYGIANLYLPIKYDDSIARLEVEPLRGRVERKFRKLAIGETDEPTFVERVNSMIRSTGMDLKTGLLFDSRAMLLFTVYTEHYLTHLFVRALKDEGKRLRKIVLTFFLCWHRNTGVAQTLNVSLLLKRYITGISPSLLIEKVSRVKKQRSGFGKNMQPLFKQSTYVSDPLVNLQDIKRLCPGSMFSMFQWDAPAVNLTAKLCRDFMEGLLRISVTITEHLRRRTVKARYVRNAMQNPQFDPALARVATFAGDFALVILPLRLREGYREERAEQFREFEEYLKDLPPKARRHRRRRVRDTTRSSRSGLQISVYMCEDLIRRVQGYYPELEKPWTALRVGAGAPVYLGAVMEYISAEILELSGNAARDRRFKSKNAKGKTDIINPGDIRLAIAKDDELNNMQARLGLSEWQYDAATQVKPQTPEPGWEIGPLREAMLNVLAQVHPDTDAKMTPRAMTLLVLLVGGVGLRIAQRAHSLTELGDKRTLTSREIQSGVRIFLPGELAKHAVSEGTKAVTKFVQY